MEILNIVNIICYCSLYVENDPNCNIAILTNISEIFIPLTCCFKWLQKESVIFKIVMKIKSFSFCLTRLDNSKLVQKSALKKFPSRMGNNIDINLYFLHNKYTFLNLAYPLQLLQAYRVCKYKA